MPPLITVAIIAGNEEDRITDAVRSAVWADEVLVLDSESNDKTAERASRAGARVIVEGWRGYGAQKNRAAELAHNDWIFSLDADERISPELAQAITALPVEPPRAAWRMARRNYFGSRPIRRWPWSWDMTVRLYDRYLCRFSEAVVHESLQVNGATGTLRGTIEHYSYRRWADVLERHVRYAILGARQARARGKKPRIGDLWLHPKVTFVRHWVGRGYLLGGLQGLRLSIAASRMTWMKYVILREMWRRPSDP